MKQIIPFKQDLLFKTKISEITSISLEHTLSLKEDDLISGEFLITGDYKMTEGSINREKFSFNLPFEISLNSKYDIDSIKIDIDNFYYEVINNESLQVNIDVYFEGDKKEDVLMGEDINLVDKDVDERNDNLKEKNVIDEEFIVNGNEVDSISEDNNISNKLNNDTKDIKEEKNNNIVSVDNDFNIFENIDNSDTYVTYHVYIVKDEDTIDSIIDKYGVSKEDISNYNDITNIKPGDKIIVPNKNE